MKMKRSKNQIKTLVRRPAYDPEIVDVVRKMIGSGLSDNELKIYLGVCRKYKADPIMKHIIPVVFNTKRGRVLNFIITRDFLLTVAHGSKEFDGMHSKILRDDKGKIIGASAECWKKGSAHSFETEVSFSEYYNAKNELWGKFPGAMIKKVAEVIVLKQAFGIDLPSDTETQKNGGSMVQINDIEIPKTRFSISDDGKIKTKAVENKKIEEAEVL